MKVEIEISEEDAALILADYHYREPLAEIIGGLAHTEATKFRHAFPNAVPRAIADFRLRQDGPATPSAL